MPSGYRLDDDPALGNSTLGYLEEGPGGDLVPLARHYNPATGDYLLETSTTAPDGYTYQAPPLGYVRLAGSPPGGRVTTYTRNALGQVLTAQTPEVTYT